MPDIKNLPDAEMVPERGQSRGGSRSNAAKQSSADSDGLGGMKGLGAMKNFDDEVEKCNGQIPYTQQLLGELITRPKLSEKLLTKPPFRFLHDLIMEVNKATGFGANLYAPEEQESSQVTDKNQKLVFLDKMIMLVGRQLNTKMEAKAMKIVQGLDAENTNIFLQLLAVAAKHAPDSTESVRSVLDEMAGGSAAPAAAAAPEPAPVRAPVAEAKNPEERPRQKPQQQQVPLYVFTSTSIWLLLTICYVCSRSQYLSLLQLLWKIEGYVVITCFHCHVCVYMLLCMMDAAGGRCC